MSDTRANPKAMLRHLVPYELVYGFCDATGSGVTGGNAAALVLPSSAARVTGGKRRTEMARRIGVSETVFVDAIEVRTPAALQLWRGPQRHGEEPPRRVAMPFPTMAAMSMLPPPPPRLNTPLSTAGPAAPAHNRPPSTTPALPTGATLGPLGRMQRGPAVLHPGRGGGHVRARDCGGPGQTP